MGLNPEQIKNLNNAVAQARNLMDHNNMAPLDALKQAGVDSNFIKNISKNLNSPMATTILNLLGLNKEDVSQKLEQLTSGSPQPPAEPIVDSDVEKYKRSMLRL